MKRIITPLAMLLLLVITAGCSLFNSEPVVSTKFVLHPSVTSRALTELPVWTTAEARITEIVFDYDGPDGSVSVTEPSLSVVNLLTGVSEPALPSFVLTPGVYRSVNFGAELLDDGSTPSILLEGTWNGNNIRVVFISGEVFEAVAGELTVEAGQNYEIQVVLNPDDWFSSMTDADLQNADVGTDGFIEISDSRNSALFDTHFAARVDDATQTVLPGGTPE